MGASAWADYLDARCRLVHEWTLDGRSAVDCVIALTVDTDAIERIRAVSTEPPIPGCSRDQIRQWKARCAELERRLLLDPSSVPPRAEAPFMSEVRSLLPHPDPLRCGCQHWSTPPRPGEHHDDCQHSPRRS